MKILALESTAVAGSAALVEDEKVLGEFYCNTALTHSQTLMPMVEQLLACTRTALEDVDLFAVTAGPGSFTGVRIGVSSVKGMAMALEKPCCAVSTLEAMACGASMVEGLVCALMDARCGQVYTALFRVSGGRVERLTKDSAVSAAEAAAACAAWPGEKLYLAGGRRGPLRPAAGIPGAERRAAAGAGALPARQAAPARAALAMAGRGEVLSADRLAPIYLRVPQAERELKKRLRTQ